MPDFDVELDELPQGDLPLEVEVHFPLELDVPPQDELPPELLFEPLDPPQELDPLPLPDAPPQPPPDPDPPPGLAHASEGAIASDPAVNRHIAANEAFLPNPDMNSSCCIAAVWEQHRRLPAALISGATLQQGARKND